VCPRYGPSGIIRRPVNEPFFKRKLTDARAYISFAVDIITSDPSSKEGLQKAAKLLRGKRIELDATVLKRYNRYFHENGRTFPESALQMWKNAFQNDPEDNLEIALESYLERVMFMARNIMLTHDGKRLDIDDGQAQIDMRFDSEEMIKPLVDSLQEREREEPFSSVSWLSKQQRSAPPLPGALVRSGLPYTTLAGTGAIFAAFLGRRVFRLASRPRVQPKTSIRPFSQAIQGNNQETGPIHATNAQRTAAASEVPINTNGAAAASLKPGQRGPNSLPLLTDQDESNVPINTAPGGAAAASPTPGQMGLTSLPLLTVQETSIVPRNTAPGGGPAEPGLSSQAKRNNQTAIGAIPAQRKAAAVQEKSNVLRNTALLGAAAASSLLLFKMLHRRTPLPAKESQLVSRGARRGLSASRRVF
jgi:hypothetical protein